MEFDKIYKFIIQRCYDLNIDESHAVKHSMDVLKYSQKILIEEYKSNPKKIYNEKIIYTASMLHDMCDNKYMDEKEGINDIKNFLNTLNYNENEIEIITKIISTMSYSKVKKNGFPNIPNYQDEYNIVRESDLLAGYDVERCIVYGMIGRDFDYIDSFYATKELYEKRMAKHIDDKLITFEYALKEAKKLDKENKERLIEIESMINNIPINENNNIKDKENEIINEEMYKNINNLYY